MHWAWRINHTNLLSQARHWSHGKWYDNLNLFYLFKNSSKINYELDVGLTAQMAVEKALEDMRAKVKGAGGCISISATGEPGFHFTTERMAWAIAKAGALSWGLEPSECNTEQLN